MGIEWSVFNLISESMVADTITEISPDGTKTITKKKNPIVTGIAVGSASLILLAYMDGGKGMVSKSFGRVCTECAKKV